MEQRKIVTDHEFKKLLTLQQYFLLLQHKDLLPLQTQTWEEISILQDIHARTVGRWISRWFMSQDFSEGRGKHGWALDDVDMQMKLRSHIRSRIKAKRGKENPHLSNMLQS